MKNSTKLASESIFSLTLVVLVACSAIFPTAATAQGSQGQNAVYSAPGACCKGSSAFIDASTFASSTDTLCSTIYKIFVGPPTYSAAVIDARGFPGNSGASMTCAASTTPWNNGHTFQNKPSTILLPAGTVVIPTTWVLPPYTRLVGEGEAITPTGFTPGTTLQAANNFSGTTMIAFGQSSCSPCTAISVERLNLADGTGQSIDGIDNAFAQNNSYVDHVGLFRIRGTGLSISGNANGSGPYSNITFDLGGDSGTSSTACAKITGLTGTKGIHGLSCVSESNDPPAAVFLDSSNNSIADVRIVGFYDGATPNLVRNYCRVSTFFSLAHRSRTGTAVHV